MTDIISLGLWIKRRRKALDLTQDELAQRVGCSPETIRKIEADVRRPSRNIVARLSEKLELAGDERTAFIKAARAELGADRLAPPAQTIARGAFAPALAGQPTPITAPAKRYSHVSVYRYPGQHGTEGATSAGHASRDRTPHRDSERSDCGARWDD